MAFRKPNGHAKKYRTKPAKEEDVEPLAVHEDPSEVRDQPADEKNSRFEENLHDLLELRKLRRRQTGIDVEKLQKGKAKKKKPKAADAGTITEGGLAAGHPAENAPEEEEESSAIRDNFTRQTNALDVDKHMMAYIETELKKRRGGSEGEDEAITGPHYLDPRDALYQTPDHLKVEKPKEKEENVTQSTAMLTAIPEVDLGIDARLRNIEKTERAKQEMKETKALRKFNDELSGSGHVATERFWRGGRPMQHTNNDNRHHNGGSRDTNRSTHKDDRGGGGGYGQRRHQNGGEQRATDDLVVERFKKKMRKY